MHYDESIIEAYIFNPFYAGKPCALRRSFPLIKDMTNGVVLARKYLSISKQQGLLKEIIVLSAPESCPTCKAKALLLAKYLADSCNPSIADEIQQQILDLKPSLARKRGLFDIRDEINSYIKFYESKEK